jgi:hypothetical protein
MHTHEKSAPPIERGLMLSESLRTEVREELRLAGCQELRGPGADTRAADIAGRMVETASEIARSAGSPRFRPGNGPDDEAIMIGRLKSSIEDTLAMIREAVRTIGATRNGIREELARSGGHQTAVRAYIRYGNPHLRQVKP